MPFRFKFAKVLIGNYLSPTVGSRILVGVAAGNLAIRKRVLFSSFVAENENEDRKAPTTSATVCIDEKRDFRSDDVLPRLRKNCGARFEFALENVNPVCEYLTDKSIGASLESVVNMFVRQPSLGDDQQVPFRRWTDAMDLLLTSAGLPIDSVVKIIAECPQILVRATRDQLESSLEVLREEHFKGKNLHLLLLRAPLLLVTSHTFLSDRLQRLKGLVTHDDLFKLLPICPNLLFDDWEDLEEIFSYVAFEIGLDQKQMMESRVLSYPLDHIRIRHQLVTRVGKWEKPHPKKPIEGNPHLTQIVDTSIDQFIRFLGITFEEYEIFEKIYEKEMDKKLKASKILKKSQANVDDESEDDYESDVD